MNPQPVDHKSNALLVAPPRRHVYIVWIQILSRLYNVTLELFIITTTTA